MFFIIPSLMLGHLVSWGGDGNWQTHQILDQSAIFTLQVLMVEKWTSSLSIACIIAWGWGGTPCEEDIQALSHSRTCIYSFLYHRSKQCSVGVGTKCGPKGRCLTFSSFSISNGSPPPPSPQSGLMDVGVEKGLLGVWMALFALFAARKFTQPIKVREEQYGSLHMCLYGGARMRRRYSKCLCGKKVEITVDPMIPSFLGVFNCWFAWWYLSLGFHCVCNFEYFEHEWVDVILPSSPSLHSRVSLRIARHDVALNVRRMTLAISPSSSSKRYRGKNKRRWFKT